MDNVVGIKSKKPISVESTYRDAFMESVYRIEQMGYPPEIMSQAACITIKDMLSPDTRFNLSMVSQPFTLELYTSVTSDPAKSLLSLDLIYTVNNKRCLIWTLETDNVHHHTEDGSSLFQGPVAEMMVGMAVPAMAMLEDSKRMDLAEKMKGYSYISGFVLGVLNRNGYHLKGLGIVAHLQRAATETLLFHPDTRESVRIVEYGCEFVRMLLNESDDGGLQ
mgnify:CR=1 FL=1